MVLKYCQWLPKPIMVESVKKRERQRWSTPACSKKVWRGKRLVVGPIWQGRQAAAISKHLLQLLNQLVLEAPPPGSFSLNFSAFAIYFEFLNPDKNLSFESISLSFVIERPTLQRPRRSTVQVEQTTNVLIAQNFWFPYIFLSKRNCITKREKKRNQTTVRLTNI